MGIITDIKPQIKNKSRFSIYVDGEFALGLDEYTVLSERLKIGDSVEQADLEEIQVKAELSAAFNKALKYAVGIRTEKQVRDHLKNKGYGQGVADEAIKKLYEYGYLDDKKFISQYIDFYGKGAGKAKLKAELLKKGAKKQDIEEALDELGGREEEAIYIAKKFMRVNPDADKIKLIRKLLYRGFNREECEKAVKAVFDSDDDFYD